MVHEYENAKRVATDRRHFSGGCAGEDYGRRRQHHASRSGDGTGGEWKETNSVELAGSGIRGQRRTRRAGEDAYDAPEGGRAAQDGKRESKSTGASKGNELAQGLRHLQGRGERRSIV